MNIRVEEAFNDCFERMLSGESLESCISRYPEHAGELDSLLRTTYDVKRKVYPIQARPEFKYWGRIRLQNSMQYDVKSAVKAKSISFNLRRNLAISMAALLVFVIASSGTVAASSDAMPDEPLYGVKLAVEQAQVTLAPSETDKAEVYAHMAEKRAQEIAVMAAKGKDDKVIATTRIMNYQLQQLEENLRKYEAVSEASTATTTNVPWGPSTNVVPPAGTTGDAPKFIPPQNTANSQPGVSGGQTQQSAQRAASIKKARDAANSSTAKSLTILQNAMNKAPDSVKSSLNNAINQTITTNKRFQSENTLKGGTTNTNRDDKPPLDSNIKPNTNINKNPVVNPADRFKNKPNLIPDTKAVR
jgi:hypothetical protein